MSDEFKAETIIFTDPRQTARVIIPVGFRLAVLVRGHSPSITPIEPGSYDMGAEQFDGEYPVAFCIIDAAHVTAWERLQPPAVGRMLDRCQAAIPAPKVH